MSKRFKVIAHLPTSVELTKRTTKNDLRVEVDTPDSTGGTVIFGQGSVEWWPDHKSVNVHRGDWNQLIALLATLPEKRSSRKHR
jgi:hypothetical protein